MFNGYDDQVRGELWPGFPGWGVAVLTAPARPPLATCAGVAGTYRIVGQEFFPLYFIVEES